MAYERPVIIVTRKLPDVVETRLRELFDARLNIEDRPYSVSYTHLTLPTILRV